MEKIKVFIVNYGVHMDSALSDLQQNYEVIVLTEGSVNIFATDRLRFELMEKIKKSNISEKDYLLLGGSTVVNGLVCLIMSELIGIVNFMIFDAKTKSYVKRDNVMGYQVNENGIVKEK
jgi:hypothetical protein